MSGWQEQEAQMEEELSLAEEPAENSRRDLSERRLSDRSTDRPAWTSALLSLLPSLPCLDTEKGSVSSRSSTEEDGEAVGGEAQRPAQGCADGAVRGRRQFSDRPSARLERDAARATTAADAAPRY